MPNYFPEIDPVTGDFLSPLVTDAIDARAAAAGSVGHNHDDHYYTEAEADGRFVRTVNGTAPDIAGNVAVEAGSAVDDLDDVPDSATRVAMTTAERAKLGGIATGAEPNVNADWDAATGDAQILNKPTIPPAPPSATTTVQGIVELATTAETTAGTDAVRAVTPLGLKAVADTKQAAGSYAPAGHTHDDRYYTETEADGRFVRTVNGAGPDGAGNVTVAGEGGSTVTDATASVKGVVQLAGDLAGTADAPTVPGLAGKANTAHGHAAADVTGLATVATSGAYDDLSGKPTLGTAAAAAATAFATAAQGSKADSAVQPAALGTAAVANIGTAAGQVKPGDWKPAWADGIDGKPGVVAAGVDAAAARASISAVGRGELALSALDYGAHPANTAAANAAALQAGLDAAGNAGKARFTIPPGVYSVSAALTQHPGTTIDGWGATLNATHGSSVIQASGVAGTPLEDLSVIGLKIVAIETLSNGRGISYQYVKNVKIHGVTITRPGNNGLDIRESSDVMVSQSDISADDYGIFMYRCKDFVITGNTIHDVLNGIDVKGSMNASADEKINGTITGNTFRNYKDHGVTGAGLAEEGYVRGLVINGNTFRNWRTDTENTTGSAIESGVMAIGWVASGNVLSDPGSHGISIFGRDHSFIGNFIEWKNVAPVAAPAIGMTSGSTAMGNVIKGCYDGIYAAGVSDVTILGNSIAAPVRYGVWVRNDAAGGPCSNVKVAFNGISGGTRGLYEQGTGGVGNQVYHNSVIGSSTANYTLITPGTWRAMNSGQTPAAVTGAKGSISAQNSLLARLVEAGVITDSTTPATALVTGAGVASVRPTAAAAGLGAVWISTTTGKPEFVAGRQEVDTFAVTAGASANGDVTVTLGGTAFTVGVLATDNTAALVAAKLRAGTYAGWTVSGSGVNAVFTSTAVGVKSAPAFSGGETGAAATPTATVVGTALAWVDAAGATV